MSYIKLEIRSGGIYIKQKTPHTHIDLNLSPHPEDNSQKVLSLIRESSVKGLFSYLMGETKKVKDIENSDDPSIQSLNNSLNQILESVAYRKRSEPYITTFFERRDSGSFVPNPKINLYQHNFKTADPTIKLLKAPLENIIKLPLQSLGDIHSYFKNSVINYEKQKDKYELLIKKANKLDKELDQKISKANQALKKGIKIALKRISDKKPISWKVIALIEEIYDLYSKNPDFNNETQNSKSGKFSVFTDLSNTKHWVDTKYHSIVRGKPSFLAKADFDIYLSKGAFEENNQNSNCFDWGKVINKIKVGPKIARWGEGGVVFVKHHLDEMGRGFEGNEKNQIFIEITALKRLGMKIKKYEWEKAIDKNKKAH